MRKIIELDEADIKKVIAKKFGCGPGQVLISVTEEYSGYDPTENKVHKVKITIKKEESVC